MEKQSIFSIYNNERGVSAIWVALLLFIFIGLGAFALDFGHIFVAKNELQNAADAGALAGARFLYDDYGIAVNPGANQITRDAARANNSENISVEVNLPNDNTGDAQRGHWSFGLGNLPKGFTANNSLIAVNLSGVSEIDLDEDTDFINAVQVTTRRETTPIVSFFARIFGYENFQRNATAVAYIGFVGKLGPGDVDAPIAICQQTVTDNPSATECEPSTYSDCNIGYMLSDGQEKNTAAWTNFSQPCDTADTEDLRDLLTCTEANPNEISLGSSMGATNGVNKAVLEHPNDNNLVDCWKSARYDSNGDNVIDENDDSIDRDGDGMPDMPWNLTLPVVNCPDQKVGNCMDTCGAVNVNIVWILVKENDIDADAPKKMGEWSNDNTNGQVRWDDFVDNFGIQKLDSNGNLEPATVENDGFKQKSIYFLPDCSPHELKGTTGGHNYGVLARIPVLVK